MLKFRKDHLNDAVVNRYQFNNVDEAKTTQSLLVRKQKMFEDVENTGSEITHMQRMQGLKSLQRTFI